MKQRYNNKNFDSEYISTSHLNFNSDDLRIKKPNWIRVKAPISKDFMETKSLIKDFSKLLKQQASRKPSGQHVLDQEYYNRIEAVQFTMSHDDGKIISDLEKSDVILVGASRTSKTPTSMYLANRGIKVANVPIVPRVQLPESLVRTGLFVVGLTTSPERLKQIRKSRLNAVGESNETEYIKEELIEEEVLRAKKLFNQHGWPSIDVTRKSIEETAAAVLDLLRIFKERNQFESSNKK